MRTDGSHRRCVHREPPDIFDLQLDFGPDGRHLVFTRSDCRGCEKRASSFPLNGIFTIRTDGTHIRRLTRNRCDENPVFSPNGRRISFDRGCNRPSIYKMRRDGTHKQRLGHGIDPSWGVRR
jgi:Tol biopolymer transport system component